VRTLACGRAGFSSLKFHQKATSPTPARPARQAGGLAGLLARATWSSGSGGNEFRSTSLSKNLLVSPALAQTTTRDEFVRLEK